MATQQLSKATEAPLPIVAASAPSFRPRLVDAESRSERDLSSSEIAENVSILRILAPDTGFVATPDAGAPPRRPPSIREAAKRTFDVAGTLVLGIVAVPLMLVIAALLRREGGPVIYRHRRVGRDGKSFECLKFRSMVPDAERKLRELLDQCPELKEEWLRDHKLRNDPRITGLGRFLRRTSLDELPQLCNVLFGDMSLVGPRPIVREEMMRYGRCLPIYLSVKPGITGLWQVTGRNDTDYRRRVALDVYYVRQRNALLDLYILVKTAGVILWGGGAY